MDIEFKEPWVAISALASSLVCELNCELAEEHPLWNTTAQAIGQRCDCDDVLFAIESKNGMTQYAVVRLTWRGKPEQDPSWPSTEFYDSLDGWIRDRMLPDHSDYVGG